MWMKENSGGYNRSQRIGDLTAEEGGSRSHRCKHGDQAVPKFLARPHKSMGKGSKTVNTA